MRATVGLVSQVMPPIRRQIAAKYLIFAQESRDEKRIPSRLHQDGPASAARAARRTQRRGFSLWLLSQRGDPRAPPGEATGGAIAAPGGKSRQADGYGSGNYLRHWAETTIVSASIGLGLLLVSPVSQAQVWTNLLTETIQIADVRNEAGYITGILCDVSMRKCFPYIIAPTPCEPDAKYPLMVNSPVGAFSTDATCSIIAETKILRIAAYDEIIKAYQSGGGISFSFPLANGQFTVVPFSTVGATAAIARAMKIPSKPPEKLPPPAIIKSM